MIETLNGVDTDAFDSKYNDIVTTIEGVLDNPDTQGIVTTYGVHSTERERIMARSLGTANMPRTIALLERALYETLQPGADGLGIPLSSLGVVGWVCGIISREPFTTRFIDLYIDNTGTELGERILNLVVAKLDRDKGWDKDESIDSIVAARAPQMLVEAAQRFGQPDTQTELTQQRDVNLPGAVTNLLRSPGGIDIEPIIRTVLALWRNDATLPFANTVMDAALADYRSAAHFLRRWGLDPSELEDAWGVGYGQDTLPDGSLRKDVPTKAGYRAETVRLIKELERERPGTFRILRQTHKLRNFARHTPDVLRGQRDNLRRHYKHNVVIAQAVPDGNGSDYMSKAGHDALFKKLTAAGVGVHFVEYKDEAELVELLSEWIASRPGETFDIMSPYGHGHKDKVESNRIAKNRRLSTITYITVDDLLNGPLGSLIARVASPNLVIPVNSCNTGADKVNGVAAVLCRVVRVARVIAPPGTAILRLETDASNGRVTKVVAKYSKRVRVGPKKWESQPVQPVEFPTARPT